MVSSSTIYINALHAFFMIFNTFHFPLDKKTFHHISQPTNKQTTFSTAIRTHRPFFLRQRPQQQQQISPPSYTTQPNRKTINRHHQIHREREGEGQTELKWRRLIRSATRLTSRTTTSHPPPRVLLTTMATSATTLASLLSATKTPPLSSPLTTTLEIHRHRHRHRLFYLTMLQRVTRRTTTFTEFPQLPTRTTSRHLSPVPMAETKMMVVESSLLKAPSCHLPRRCVRKALSCANGGGQFFFFFVNLYNDCVVLVGCDLWFMIA